MPTYQYACTQCGEQLEVQQRFTDDALSTCPVCAGRLRKVFNAVGVVFKGSGFYRTDSRAAKADAKADGKADANADGKADGKVDAKPDPKTAAGTTALNGAGKNGSASTGGTADKGSTAGAGKPKAAKTS